MIDIDNTLKAIFSDPKRRRAWVIYRVSLQGRSLAHYAREAGVTRTCLYRAFIQPYPRMEKIVADAVGLTPQILFPERYDADGLPNRPMGRPKKSIHKTINKTATNRNVKDQEVI